MAMQEPTVGGGIGASGDSSKSALLGSAANITAESFSDSEPAMELERTDSRKKADVVRRWLSELSGTALSRIPPFLARVAPDDSEAPSTPTCIASSIGGEIPRRRNVVFSVVGPGSLEDYDTFLPATSNSSFVKVLRPDLSGGTGEPTSKLQISCMACCTDQEGGRSLIITGGKLTFSAETYTDPAGALHVWRNSSFGENAGNWCCHDADPDRELIPILCLSLDGDILITGHESRPENSIQAPLARLPTISRRHSGPDMTIWRLCPSDSGDGQSPLSIQFKQACHDTGNVTAVQLMRGKTPGALTRVVSVSMGEVMIWAMPEGDDGSIQPMVLLHQQPAHNTLTSGPPLAYLPRNGIDLLAAPDCDKTVVIWEFLDVQKDWQKEERNPLRELHVLKHQRDIYGAKFFVSNNGDEDNEYLVTTNHDQNLRIWHVQSGICVRTATHDHNPFPIISVDASKCGFVVSGSKNGQIAIFHAMTGARMRSMEGHTDSVTAIGFLEGGHQVASCSHDGSLRLWQVTCSKNSVRKLGTAVSAGHTDAVYSIAFSSDASLMATSSRDKSIKIYNCRTAACIHTFTGHTDFVFMVAFHPKDNILASASHDHSIKIWSLSTTSQQRSCLQTIDRKFKLSPESQARYHSRKVSSVAFHPSGEIMASGSYDKSVILYHRPYPAGIPESGDAGYAPEALQWVPYHEIHSHQYHIWDLAFCQGGEYLASASWDYKVHVHSRKSLIPSPEHSNELPHKLCHAEAILDCKAKVWAVAFEPVDKRPLLLTGSADSNIRVWSKPWGPWKLQVLLEGHGDTVTGLAWHPEGGKFVSSSFDKTVRLWVAKPKNPDKPEGSMQGDVMFHAAGLWSAYSFPTTSIAWGYQPSSFSEEASFQGRPHNHSTGCTMITVGTQDGSVYMMDATDAGQQFIPYGRARHVFDEVVQQSSDSGHVMVQFLKEYPGSLMSIATDFSMLLYNVLLKFDNLHLVKQMLELCQRSNISPLLATGPDGKLLIASVTAHATVQAMMDCIVGMGADGADINAAAMATDVGTCVMLMLVDAFPDQAVRLIEHMGLTKAQEVVYDPDWRPRRRCLHYEDSMVTYDRNSDLDRYSTKYPVGLWRAAPQTYWQNGNRKSQDVTAVLSTFPNVLGPMTRESASKDVVRTAVSSFSVLRGHDLEQEMEKYQNLENSFLHLACRSGEPQLFATPLGRAILNFKWEAYGRRWLLRHFVIYVAFLTAVLFQAYCLARKGHAGGWLMTYEDTDLWMRLSCGSSAFIMLMSVVWTSNEWRQSRAEGLKRYFSSGWNILDVVLLVLGYACSILGLMTTIRGLISLHIDGIVAEDVEESWVHSKDMGRQINVLAVVSALASFATCMKSFYFLRAYERTSGLVRMTIQIAYDMRWLMLLLLIVTFGATFSFFVLMTINFEPETTVDKVYANTGRCSDSEWGILNNTLNYNATDDYGCSPPDSFPRSFMHVFSMMLGGFEIDFFDTLGPGYKWIGHILFICYAIFQMILLLNLLIALMGDSYEKVQENAYIESLAQRAALLVDIELEIGQERLQRQGFFPRYLHALMAKELVSKAGNQSQPGKEWAGVAGTLRHEINAHITSLRASMLAETDRNREMLSECAEQIKQMRAEMMTLAQQSAPLPLPSFPAGPTDGAHDHQQHRHEGVFTAQDRSGSSPMPVLQHSLSALSAVVPPAPGPNIRGLAARALERHSSAGSSSMVGSGIIRYQ